MKLYEDLMWRGLIAQTAGDDIVDALNNRSLGFYIGVDPTGIIKKFRTGMPVRHNPMEKGLNQFSGLIVDIDEKTKKINNYEIIHIVD